MKNKNVKQCVCSSKRDKSQMHACLNNMQRHKMVLYFLYCTMNYNTTQIKKHLNLVEYTNVRKWDVSLGSTAQQKSFHPIHDKFIHSSIILLYLYRTYTHTHSPKENSKYLICLNMLFWTVGCECPEKNKKKQCRHSTHTLGFEPGSWNMVDFMWEITELDTRGV